MIENLNIHFDEALPRAVAAVRRVLPELPGAAVRFIRDVQGYVFVVVPDDVLDERLDSLRTELRATLGRYTPPLDEAALRFADTLEGDGLGSVRALVQIMPGDWPAYVIEHWLSGLDWLGTVHPVEAGGARRVTFYSLKGGVGRSTALMLWARHLVNALGKRVIVVDLDLEAPGIGSQLLDDDELPRFGVVDWLADSLVGAQDAERMRDLLAPSPLGVGRRLLVVPAAGTECRKHPHSYIAKLARVYAGGASGGDGSGFAQSVNALLALLEVQYQPDVILLDSRAGLHETAAAALLHLDAQLLLFAADLHGTWEGYRFLLSHLGQVAQGARSHALAAQLERGHGEVDPDWRYRFKMVHAKAQPLRSAGQDFVAHSYEMWLDTLYDEERANEVDLDAFAFDRDDEAAPHHSFRIQYNSAFERIDLKGRADDLDDEAIGDAFGRFFDQLGAWVFDSPNS